MTRRPPVNIAQSVRMLLRTRAKDVGWPFNALLQYYTIDRFLYGFGQPKHAETRSAGSAAAAHWCFVGKRFALPLLRSVCCESISPETELN